MGKVLKIGEQKRFLAQLIVKCQELDSPSFTVHDLLLLFLQHALSESSRSVKNDSILSDCHKSSMKIVKYLTASNPQANKERMSLELRCLEID